MDVFYTHSRISHFVPTIFAPLQHSTDSWKWRYYARYDADSFSCIHLDISYIWIIVYLKRRPIEVIKIELRKRNVWRYFRKISYSWHADYSCDSPNFSLSSVVVGILFFLHQRHKTSVTLSINLLRKLKTFLGISRQSIDWRQAKCRKFQQKS